RRLMPADLPQFAFFLFVIAIGLVGYEMAVSLRPAECAECPHCRARRQNQPREVANFAEMSANRHHDRRRNLPREIGNFAEFYLDRYRARRRKRDKSPR